MGKADAVLGCPQPKWFLTEVEGIGAPNKNALDFSKAF